MSKSEGNFVTINDVLRSDKIGGRKWPGEVVRMALLMTNYREPLDFSNARLEEAANVANRLARRAEGAQATRPHPSVVDALRDDLDTTGAFRVLSEDGVEPEEIVASLDLMGIDLRPKTDVDVNAVVKERLKLIAARNWNEADRLRDELLEQGIQLKDGKDPETGERVTTWELVR